MFAISLSLYYEIQFIKVFKTMSEYRLFGVDRSSFKQDAAVLLFIIILILISIIIFTTDFQLVTLHDDTMNGKVTTANPTAGKLITSFQNSSIKTIYLISYFSATVNKVCSL